jgi:hypothetical protein
MMNGTEKILTQYALGLLVKGYFENDEFLYWLPNLVMEGLGREFLP